MVLQEYSYGPLMRDINTMLLMLLFQFIICNITIQALNQMPFIFADSVKKIIFPLQGLPLSWFSLDSPLWF